MSEKIKSAILQREMDKVCLLANPGGHMSQLSSIKGIIKKEQRFFVTFPSPEIASLLKGEEVDFLPYHSKGKSDFINIIKSIPSTIISTLLIFNKREFSTIITTGANLGIIFCFLSFLAGKRILFIESFSGEITSFGKLINRISYKTFVQWDEQTKFYKSATKIPHLYKNLDPVKKNQNTIHLCNDGFNKISI